jgi:hypothetical protein
MRVIKVLDVSLLTSWRILLPTPPAALQHLQILKMFAATFQLAGRRSCLHDKACSIWNNQATLHYTDFRKMPA